MPVATGRRLAAPPPAIAGFREPDPEPGDRSGPAAARSSFRARRQPVHQQQRRSPPAPTRRRGASAARHWARACAIRQRHDEDEDRQPGRKRSPASQRRVAEDVLQVDREVREEREHPGADAEGRHRDTDERRRCRKRLRSSMGLVCRCSTATNSPASRTAPPIQRAEDQRARPSRCRCREHAENDQEQRSPRRSAGPRRRCPCRLRVARLAHPHHRDQQREGSYGDGGVPRCASTWGSRCCRPSATCRRLFGMP